MHASCHGRPGLHGALAVLAGHLALLGPPAAVALRLGGGENGECPVDLAKWAEERVAEQLQPWAETGITKQMIQHARDYTPRWRQPAMVRLRFLPTGEHHLIKDGVDVGTKAWMNYTARAIKNWPFKREELREFSMLLQRGDFPMLLKTDPQAAPELNAPMVANTNNGKFYEVLMPVSWRPQFDYDFPAKKADSLRLASRHPWKERKDVAVWRGVVGCATGCGARGHAYFPESVVEKCSDDLPNWDANAIGATWGCGDDLHTNTSSAFMKHPRVQLVSKFQGGEGERCGIDVGFHTWQRHGAFFRHHVERSVLESWMKDEMKDEETASHRYVFHVGNNGYSDRSWRMFALGAVVFLVDNGWEEFYFRLLKPWVHYIPVKADASDACEMVQWARGHPKEAEEIANNGREFVEHCLTESFIDRYVAEMIRQLGKLQALGKERR